MSPSEVVNLLRPRRHSLKWLYLSYSHHEKSSEAFAEDMMPMLRGFTALETLTIDDLTLFSSTPNYPYTLHSNFYISDLCFPPLGHRDTQFRLHEAEGFQTRARPGLGLQFG
ncbi:hypothetical protein V8C42DRAFT_300911 [Trichoderma barbatum]